MGCRREMDGGSVTQCFPGGYDSEYQKHATTDTVKPMDG